MPRLLRGRRGRASFGLLSAAAACVAPLTPPQDTIPFITAVGSGPVFSYRVEEQKLGGLSGVLCWRCLGLSEGLSASGNGSGLVRPGHTPHTMGSEETDERPQPLVPGNKWSPVRRYQYDVVWIASPP
eukprot:gene16084-biopygen14305